MKKLFTLTLALTVAFAGFAQVRTMSPKDMKPAQMKKAARMEASFENVQSQPNMTRTDGELDYSTYDWQSNAAARTWTHVWADGKVNFAYTMATDATSYSDRGTGIGTYDYVNDEWIPCEGRVENEKTGFGCIAQYGDNGLVVAAHTATECGIYIIEDKDNITPGCAITMPKLNNDKEPTWPVVMTSGPNRDIIHVLVTAYSETGSPMYYFRSKDGGASWDKENEVIPYLSSEYFSDWGSNIAYFMETTEDNCLAFVVSNAWSDCMVIYSYDDGETWERKVFWHHPGINSSFESWFMYPRWTSAQWGVDGELCLVYEFNGSTGAPGSGSYYPGIGGVAFWSENMPYNGATPPTYGADPSNPSPMQPGQPFIMDSAYLYEDIYASLWRWSDATHEMWPEYIGYLPTLDNDGNWEDPYNATEFNIDDTSLHGSYNSGCVAMPVLCMLPDCNGWDMVAVWSAMDENNQDGNGNFFYKLFAAYSGDGGRTWSKMVHLTNDFMYQYSECVYTQAVVIGTTLIIAAQVDGETGTYVQGDDSDPYDNYYQGFTFELTDLFPEMGVGLEEQNGRNTHMTLYPNPAVDRLNVSLSQNAEIVIYNMMGQVIRTMDGQVGANTIDLSGLNSGVYFINAGSDTQKFIVK